MSNVITFGKCSIGLAAHAKSVWDTMDVGKDLLIIGDEGVPYESLGIIERIIDINNPMVICSTLVKQPEKLRKQEWVTPAIFEISRDTSSLQSLGMLVINAYIDKVHSVHPLEEPPRLLLHIKKDGGSNKGYNNDYVLRMMEEIVSWVVMTSSTPIIVNDNSIAGTLYKIDDKDLLSILYSVASQHVYITGSEKQVCQRLLMYATEYTLNKG